jgi:hypothetical protein
MGHSSLIRIDRADAEPAGRDTASLGPSDSSDSGSDLAGFEALDVNDPNLPVDVALRDDMHRSPVPSESGGGSDAAGTGERGSAAADAGRREAADISVDRIFDPEHPDLDDLELDPDLALFDAALAPDDEDEEEDRPAGRAAVDSAAADALERVLGQLADDHTRVKAAYEAFRALDLPADDARCETLVEQVLFELQLHAALEEELLYPVARTVVDDEALLDEAEVEHESMHGLIARLAEMSPGDEKYAARFAVLCEYVLHHVREEEGKLFPKLRRLDFDWLALEAAVDERRQELQGWADAWVAGTPAPRVAGTASPTGADTARAPDPDATQTEPDEDAPEPRRDDPATGIASHGSASPRKI